MVFRTVLTLLPGIIVLAIIKFKSMEHLSFNGEQCVGILEFRAVFILGHIQSYFTTLTDYGTRIL